MAQRKFDHIVLKRTVPADTSALRELRETVEQEALRFGFPGEIAATIALAVDEACANIIEHAYGEAKRRFLVEIGSVGEGFVVRLIDSGRPFTGPLPTKLDIHEKARKGRTGGLGLHIISKVMDDVDYSTMRGRKNVLRLVKYLPS